MKLLAALVITISFGFNYNNQPGTFTVAEKHPIKTGAEQTEKYLPLLKGKRVAMHQTPLQFCISPNLFLI